MIKHSTRHDPPTLFEYAWTQQLIQHQRTTSTTLTTSTTTTTTTTTTTPHYNPINIHHLIATSYNHHINSTYICIHIAIHQCVHSYNNSSTKFIHDKPSHLKTDNIT